MRTELRGEQTGKRSLLRRPAFWVALITAASLVVGILSLLLAYLALNEPEPGVTFETISDTDVLDLRRPLQDLSIVFRGQDVQEQNLNLRILTINVVNSGGVDILPSHYDHEDEWGIKFKDGQVVEARLVDTSSEYLRSKVVPQRLGIDTVAFPKVIFEEGAFFAVEILLLHPKSESPSISSIGKIAGINKITVLTRPLAREEVSFGTQLFQGSALIQVLRTIIYLVGFFLAIIVVVVVLVGIADPFSRLNARRRRTRILQTRTIRHMDQDEIKDLLIANYESRGTVGLKGLQELIKEPGRLEWVTPPARWIVRDHDHIRHWTTANRVFDIESGLIGSWSMLHGLMTTGILTRGEDDCAVIDPTFGEAVDNILGELEN